MDVQLSRDAEVVVFHDETLDRVTGYHGYLRDLTVSELKRLDASAGFRGLYGKNEIPTLREFLELVAPTGADRKHGAQEQPPVLPPARGEGYRPRPRVRDGEAGHFLLVQQRLHPALPPSRARRSTRAFSGRVRSSDQAGQYCRDNDVQFFMPDGNYLSDDIVADFRAHGIRLAPWTANSLPEIRRLADWDVYCINTNYPNLRK